MKQGWFSRIFSEARNEMSDQSNDNQAADQGEVSPEQQQLENDLKKLQDERDTLFERLARVTADFKNAQKRLEDDKRQAIEYANSALITALLPVIDNFERALAIDPAKTDVQAILKGMELICDQWISVLRSQHVEQINPKPGDKFDPVNHQAIMQQPSEEFKDAKEPVVTLLLQKGYTMRSRVLRPAQVAVNTIAG